MIVLSLAVLLTGAARANLPVERPAAPVADSGAQGEAAREGARRQLAAAQRHLQTGDYAAAGLAAKAALEQDPRSVEALETLAWIRLQEDRWGQAIESANAALEVDGGRVRARLLLAFGFERWGDRAKAIRQLEMVVQAEPLCEGLLADARDGKALFEPKAMDDGRFLAGLCGARPPPPSGGLGRLLAGLALIVASLLGGAFALLGYKPRWREALKAALAWQPASAADPELAPRRARGRPRIALPGAEAPPTPAPDGGRGPVTLPPGPAPVSLPFEVQAPPLTLPPIGGPASGRPSPAPPLVAEPAAPGSLGQAEGGQRREATRPPIRTPEPAREFLGGRLGRETPATTRPEDKYRQVRMLGRSEDGVLWEAFDRSLQRAVAIEELELPGGNQSREAALARARELALLHHPAILDLYEVADLQNRLWLVFELIEGKTLRDRLAQAGRLSLDEAREILLPVCEALDFAHASGVFHGHLKPSRVLLAEAGYVKLTGFGSCGRRSGAAGTWPRRPSARRSAPSRTCSPWARAFTRCSAAILPSRTGTRRARSDRSIRRWSRGRWTLPRAWRTWSPGRCAPRSGTGCGR
ncbi:MAG: protein kinase [Elusimicrobia bacterium]|nr:protein kinase [Elusimicrobiota bacterium]